MFKLTLAHKGRIQIVLRYSRIQFTPDLMPADTAPRTIAARFGEGTSAAEIHQAPADVVSRSRAFIQSDLSGIAQAAEKK